MNLVEAKSTSFVIEAEDSDDIYEALGELDFTYFEKNCKWVTSEYEPPIIEDIVSAGKNKGICNLDQTKKIQTKYNQLIKDLTKEQ